MRTSVTPSTDPSGYAYTHRLRVRFAETDAMGIVHHSRYLPYLEEARVEYLRSIGHPYHEIHEAGTDLAVLEAFVQYRLPLRFDDLVDVYLLMAQTTRTTFQMAYLLCVDNAAHATAVTVHGAVINSRPTRLPAWLAELAEDRGT